MVPCCLGPAPSAAMRAGRELDRAAWGRSGRSGGGVMAERGPRFSRCRSKTTQLTVVSLTFPSLLSQVPNGAIDAAEVAPDLAADKAFVQGADVSGRPVIFVRVAKHRRRKGAALRVKRFICWVLDVAAASNDNAVNPDGKMVGVFDMRGISMECLDAGALRSIFDILAAHFPERLAKMTFVDAPYMFWAVWRVVAPFVDPVTRDKIEFASTADIAATLPPAIVPVVLGGTAPLIPVSDVAEAVGLLPRGAAAAAVAAVPPSRDASGDGDDEDADLDAAVAAELAAAAARGEGEGKGGVEARQVVVATAGVVRE